MDNIQTWSYCILLIARWSHTQSGMFYITNKHAGRLCCCLQSRIDFNSITSNLEENIIAQRLGFHTSGDLMEVSTRKCQLCFRCFSYKNGYTKKNGEHCWWHTIWNYWKNCTFFFLQPDFYKKTDFHCDAQLEGFY